MEIFWAKWLPFLSFWRAGRPLAALVALVLQLSVLLWPIAAFWAMTHVVRAQETAGQPVCTARTAARATCAKSRSCTSRPRAT